MRKTIHSLKKALDAHDSAFKDYSSSTAALHLMLGEHLPKLRGAAASDASIAGHLGAITKVLAMHKGAHDSASKYHAAVHSQLNKSVDAIADRLGISDANRNATGAGPDADTFHSGADTTSAGTVVHSLKGLPAGELAKASSVLPLDNNAAPRAQIRAMAGVGLNKNARSDPFGFAGKQKVDDAPLGGQPRVESEYQKRQR